MSNNQSTYQMPNDPSYSTAQNWQAGMNEPQMPQPQGPIMRPNMNMNMGMNNVNIGWNSMPPKPSVIPGRTILNPNEIMPYEVPSDGTPAFFPLANGSEIYMKFVGQDGTTQAFKYVQVPWKAPDDQGPSELSLLSEKLDLLCEEIKQIKEGGNSHNNQARKDR